MYVRCRECEIFHGPTERWRLCPECGAPLAPLVAIAPTTSWALVSIPSVAVVHPDGLRRPLAIGVALLALVASASGVAVYLGASPKHLVTAGLAKIAAAPKVPQRESPYPSAERKAPPAPPAIPKEVTSPKEVPIKPDAPVPKEVLSAVASIPPAIDNEVARESVVQRPRGTSRSRSSSKRAPLAAPIRNEELQLLPPASDNPGEEGLGGQKLEAATALRVVSEQAKAFQSCVDSALKRNPDLAVGVVELRLRVGASGLVQRASVSPQKYRQQPWAKCFVDTARHIAFPPSSRGTELVVPLKVGVALSP